MQTLTYPTLAEEIAGSALPVLIEFSAGWCPPCRVLEPVVEQIAGELADRVRVFKIDQDESPEASIDHQVMAVPTLILFRDGREVRRWIGARGKRQLAAELDEALS